MQPLHKARSIRVSSPPLHPRLLRLALIAVIAWNLCAAFTRPSKRQVASVLHARTLPVPQLKGLLASESRSLSAAQSHVMETTLSFPQHGKGERGVHYRLENTQALRNQGQDALLVVVVLNDHRSWGKHRSADDFFTLIAQLAHPKQQTSLTMLTSSAQEFQKLQREMQQRIGDYAQFSLLLRDDFNLAADSLTRENRHDTGIQNARRRMIARYRNFALLSTLQPWQQHVVWLDADVHIIPPTLITKMIASKRDIVEPICLYGEPPNTYEYDLNAWVGVRKRPGSLRGQRNGFVPGDLHIKRMTQFRDGPDDFVPLDSVGGTMLYVRAEVHRQGVIFPHHYIIGGQWDMEGFDGIETEGFCYSAHFLGFKCWGMPHDPIYHAELEKST